MKFFKILILPAAMILMLTAHARADETEKTGNDILMKADSRFYPDEGTFDFTVKQTDAEGNTTEFGLQGYKKGSLHQTGVFIKPQINMSDVGMRSSDVIYYKPHTWPKPQIQSYQSLFMSTTFSWGDVMSSDIAMDYKTSSLDKTNDNGTNEYHMVLLPRRENLYARIDMWIDSQNYSTYKRLYFTASGDRLKAADYTDIQEQDGRVVSFKVNMKDYIQEVTTYAQIFNLREVKLPPYLFDPQNIGRIRARLGQ
jgi:hypothetical protein